MHHFLMILFRERELVGRKTRPQKKGLILPSPAPSCRNDLEGWVLISGWFQEAVSVESNPFRFCLKIFQKIRLSWFRKSLTPLKWLKIWVSHMSRQSFQWLYRTQRTLLGRLLRPAPRVDSLAPASAGYGTNLWYSAAKIEKCGYNRLIPRMTKICRSLDLIFVCPYQTDWGWRNSGASFNASTSTASAENYQLVGGRPWKLSHEGSQLQGPATSFLGVQSSDPTKREHTQEQVDLTTLDVNMYKL